MKSENLDVIYITTPMPKEERLALLKKFQQAAFLQGIDKGTFLENCKIERLEKYKERKMKKQMHELVDFINDNMQPGIKRFKRRKYRGLYKYPKKGKSKSPVTSPTISYTNCPLWMQNPKDHEKKKM